QHPEAEEVRHRIAQEQKSSRYGHAEADDRDDQRITLFTWVARTKRDEVGDDGDDRAEHEQTTTHPLQQPLPADGTCREAQFGDVGFECRDAIGGFVHASAPRYAVDRASSISCGSPS